MNQSQNNIEIQNVKIGIIGGGAIGRVLLNTLLVFQKDGIEPRNITVSTRQEEDLEFYKNVFKVNVVFDNQKLAQESDILIITTPATLDNWIIVDLKQILQKRVNLPLAPQSNNKVPNSDNTPKNKLNPLVYITTSNMSKQKVTKLFSFPILTPFVRGHQHNYLEMLVNKDKLKSVETIDYDLRAENIEKQIAEKMGDNAEYIKQVLFYVFEKYFYNPDKQKKYSTVTSSEKNSKSGKTISLDVKTDVKMYENKVIKMQGKSEKINERVSQKGGESKKSSANISTISANLNSPNLEIVRTLIDEVIQVNGSAQQTFLVRSRKWRMAYHNFIA